MAQLDHTIIRPTKGLADYLFEAQDRRLKSKLVEAQIAKALKDKDKFDLDGIAKQAAFKSSLGQDLDDNDKAAISAYSAFHPAQTYTDPLTQNIVSRPSLAEALGIGKIGAAAAQAGAPAAPSTGGAFASMLGVPIDDTAPAPKGPTLASGLGLIDAEPLPDQFAGGTAMPESIPDAVMPMGGNPANPPDITAPLSALPADNSAPRTPVAEFRAKLGRVAPPPALAGSARAQIAQFEDDRAAQRAAQQAELGLAQKQAEIGMSQQADQQKALTETKVSGLQQQPGVIPSNDDAKQTKEVLTAYKTINDNMQRYKAILAKNPNPIAGSEDAKALQQAKTQMGVGIKSLETLGAYDKGVANLLNELIGDPILFNGSIADVVMNPVGSINSTAQKLTNPRNINDKNNKQFEAYLDDKMRNTAAARGYDASSVINSQNQTRSTAQIRDQLKALGMTDEEIDAELAK